MPSPDIDTYKYQETSPDSTHPVVPLVREFTDIETFEQRLVSLKGYSLEEEDIATLWDTFCANPNIVDENKLIVATAIIKNWLPSRGNDAKEIAVDQEGVDQIKMVLHEIEADDPFNFRYTTFRLATVNLGQILTDQGEAHPVPTIEELLKPRAHEFLSLSQAVLELPIKNGLLPFAQAIATSPDNLMSLRDTWDNLTREMRTSVSRPLARVVFARNVLYGVGREHQHLVTDSLTEEGMEGWPRLEPRTKRRINNRIELASSLIELSAPGARVRTDFIHARRAIGRRTGSPQADQPFEIYSIK